MTTNHFITFKPYQDLYSLRRHHCIGISNLIINLRRSSDRLRLTMGIPIPLRQHFLMNRSPVCYSVLFYNVLTINKRFLLLLLTLTGISVLSHDFRVMMQCQQFCVAPSVWSHNHFCSVYNSANSTNTFLINHVQHQVNLDKYTDLEIQKNIQNGNQDPLLLTWFNFNPSMDK